MSRSSTIEDEDGPELIAVEVDEWISLDRREWELREGGVLEDDMEKDPGALEDEGAPAEPRCDREVAGERWFLGEIPCDWRRAEEGEVLENNIEEALWGGEGGVLEDNIEEALWGGEGGVLEDNIEEAPEEEVICTFDLWFGYLSHWDFKWNYVSRGSGDTIEWNLSLVSKYIIRWTYSKYFSSLHS
jgi:hypothetical protein